MSETITLQALDLSGETLTMFLRKSDGTLLNTGGDAMTESGSTGVFTATLAEARTGLGPLAVRICAGSETADNLLYDGFLSEGSSVIDSTMTVELDSDARVKLDATQPDYAPLKASDYTAPANSDITAIKAKTDNLPSDPADQSLVEAAITSATAPLATSSALSSVASSVTTILGKFTGITLLARWLGALAGKTADTVTRAEINATTAGAGYNETTDSQEAIRDRGDVAWGSSGGGDATLANQQTIINLIDAYLVSITAAAQETPGTIAGFPSTLNVGDSYTDEMNNAITITLVDDQDNPVDTWGDYDVNHAGFTPTLVISGSGGKVTATVAYDTDHFLVEIPSSESLRASPGTATMQFVLKWYVADRLVAQKTIVTGQAVTWVKQI